MGVDDSGVTPAAHTVVVRLRADYYFLAMHCELFILCEIRKHNLQLEIGVPYLVTAQRVSNMHRN